MSQNPGIPLNPELDPSITTCANCRTPMPGGLRFCRNCGFRLGEGTAEYTETVRFQDGMGGANAPFGANYAAPLAQATGGAVGKRRKRMGGVSWMFIGIRMASGLDRDRNHPLRSRPGEPHPGGLPRAPLVPARGSGGTSRHHRGAALPAMVAWDLSTSRTMTATIRGLPGDGGCCADHQPIP